MHGKYIYFEACLKASLDIHQCKLTLQKKITKRKKKKSKIDSMKLSNNKHFHPSRSIPKTEYRREFP